VTIIFGLLSAFSYGFADFFGAIAAKKVRALAVTTISFSFGLLLAIILSFFVGADFSPETVVTGIYAGICSAIAISCLYAALALGPISIVSPLTAVVSAIIPVVVDVATGQKLSAFAGIAIALILIAVVMVAFVPGQDLKLPTFPAFIYSIGAGLGFSGIFVFLDSTDKESGLGPLVVMRVVGILMLLAGLVILWLRNRSQPVMEKELFSKSVLWLVLLAGTGDVLGNVSFLIATREGALAISAVLTSLYPVGTILLARFVLKERIAISQSMGIVLGLGACAFLALG